MAISPESNRFWFSTPVFVIALIGAEPSRTYTSYTHCNAAIFASLSNWLFMYVGMSAVSSSDAPPCAHVSGM